MEIDNSDDVHSITTGYDSFNGPSTALKDLAVRLYNARQDGYNDTNQDNEQAKLLGLALHHFAQLRQHARKLAIENKQNRQKVADTRTTMDSAFLVQQNRNYEIGYLYREIEKCNDYEWVWSVLVLTTS
jgi:hypothetical protein